MSLKQMKFVDFLFGGLACISYLEVAFATIGGYAYFYVLGDGKSYRKRLNKKRSMEVCTLVHGNKTFAFLLCSLKLNMDKYEQNVQVGKHKANHNS